MRLLVFRFSSLGDVALTVPALRSVLSLNPELELIVVTRKPFTVLFDGLPRTQVFSILPYDEHKGLIGLKNLRNQLIRQFQPDAIVDLHNVLRTQILRLLFSLKGVKSVKYQKDRNARKELTRDKNKRYEPLRHTVLEYLKVFKKVDLKAELIEGPWLATELESSKSGIIGFAPLASSRQKTWPLVKSAQLVRRLSEYGKEVWLFGGPSEIDELKAISSDAKKVQIIPEVSKGIRDDLQFIRQLDVMVSMDSANMHLAALSGIPTVSIWGATHSSAGFAPLGLNHSIVEISQNELACRPCSIFGQKTCARGDWACLEGIKTETVLNILKELDA